MAKRDYLRPKIAAYFANHESGTSREVATAICARMLSVVHALAMMHKRSEIFRWGTLSNFTYTLDRDLAETKEAERLRLPPVSESTFIHKLGAAFGGVRTLEDVRMRCHIDPDYGCWVWRGAVARSADRYQLPTFHLAGVGGQSVQRFVWQASGRPLNRGDVVWRTCANRKCVCPDHLGAGTRKEFGAHIRSTGGQKGSRERSAKLKASEFAAKRRVFTPEVVSEIIASAESHKAWAERLGVHPSSVARAVRKPVMQVDGASVFSWRPS